MKKQILCVNASGMHQDRVRMDRLGTCLSKIADLTSFDIDKTNRRAAAVGLWSLLTSRKWDLVYQEGTGIAAGLPLLRAGMTRAQKYVVSSGDSVSGFFRVTRGAVVAVPFRWYERALYRRAAGFIGWSPYLAGRALELGAPRAVTVEGAVDLDVFKQYAPAERVGARDRFGLRHDHLVLGMVGSITWVDRQKYCYGLDLVETIKHLRRTDVSLLIVGDGDGLPRLRALVPPDLQSRVVFTGRLPYADVVTAMNAMDIGFITQTLDQLGSYRLTTKMPEYLACGLPIAMSPTPGFFDYVGAAGWALPSAHPAAPEFHIACAKWLDSLSSDEVKTRAQGCRAIAADRFSYDSIGSKFAQFVEHILAA